MIGGSQGPAEYALGNRSNRPAHQFAGTSGRREFLTDTGTGRRFWPVTVRGPQQPPRDALDLVFMGNAFEAPPRVHRQRPRPRRSRLRRTLRALVLWLLQPSPFFTRARRR